MARRLRAEQYGALSDIPQYSIEERLYERQRVIGKALAERAGLPTPENQPYQNLGNGELPVFRHKEAIQKNIRDHQISMLEGATGSGKSTQIIQYALEMGYSRVIHIVPRVLLADNLADRVESELAEVLGSDVAKDLIGVRHSESSTGYGKPLQVMTAGTYLRIVNGEGSANENEAELVIGDEIHEKDFEVELAIAVASQRLRENPKSRMVLVSATLNPEPIRETYTEINGRDIPLVSVEGRPHELEFIEEPDLTAAEAYAKYGANHAKSQIFTAGKREIKDLSGKLEAPDTAKNLLVTPLHARLSRSEIKQATDTELTDGEYQVTPSTNAGQSGITISGQTLVITDGTTRRSRLNQEGGSGLFKEHAAQDEIIQQIGRAGRDVAGGVGILVKPDDENFKFKSLEERAKQAPPQIDQVNLNSGILLATSIGVNFYEINKYLINKVQEQSRILEGYESLYRLGAIDEHNEVTELGHTILRFPVRPEFGRALAEGLTRGASAETMQHLAATISALEAGGMRYFEPGGGKNWKQDIRPETQDDVMAELDMFYATRPFCTYNEIDKTYEVNESALQSRNYDLKNTRQAHKTFDKIVRALGIDSNNIPPEGPSSDEVEEIRDYLTSGLFDYAYIKSGVDGTSRKPQYVSVVNDIDSSTKRELTDRGTYKDDAQLLIGTPRDFEKIKSGELIEHNVIENVFPTSVQKLTRHVLHLAEREASERSEVIGGRLKQTDDLYFGRLKIGNVDSVTGVQHSPETRSQLREAAFSKPTQTIEELTSIKRQLEELKRLALPDEYDHYFPNGIMTQDWLQETIDEVIDSEVDSIYTLDNKLRTKLVQNNISIETWVSEDQALELLERSPDTIELPGGATYTLHYNNGRPSINGFNLRDVDTLPSDGLYLDDGREVLISYRIDKHTKTYRAGEVKTYAATLDYEP